MIDFLKYFKTKVLIKNSKAITQILNHKRLKIINISADILSTRQLLLKESLITVSILLSILKQEHFMRYITFNYLLFVVF